MQRTYDIAIVGTGAGGGTLAYALRNSGARVLLIECGELLPQEPQNWSPDAVFFKGRYKPKEDWFDSAGRPFKPGVHYFVGGNTKVFGAALPRLRLQTNSHQCGTLRFGADPASSVLDPYCRTHDVSNLYVVDSSFFPSSAAQNPALTIAAQALRVADHLQGAAPGPTRTQVVAQGANE